MKKLKGLIAAPFTPLTAEGELNNEKIKDLIQLYQNNGVKGAFIAGSTGEGVALSHEEKKSLMKAWGAAPAEGLTKIFMLGGTCLKEMQELALLAEEHQMDAISILCPYYFRPKSVKTLVAFCKEVADVVPHMPFYYYHIPSLTGGDFSMLEFLKEAEGKIPNLAGIKYTDTNLFDFQACVNFKNGYYNMLWGSDEALLSALIVGADGGVGSTYNYAAPLYLQVIEAFEKKDLEQARQLQYKAVEMVQLLVKYGGIGAGKAFMKLIGLDCGWFRSPITAPTANEVVDLKADLTEIGFFDFCNKIA
jgi:N-acetylneuraminate lyase